MVEPYEYVPLSATIFTHLTKKKKLLQQNSPTRSPRIFSYTTNKYETHLNSAFSLTASSIIRTCYGGDGSTPFYIDYHIYVHSQENESDSTTEHPPQHEMRAIKSDPQRLSKDPAIDNDNRNGSTAPVLTVKY